jgi:hypothetical protein
LQPQQGANHLQGRPILAKHWSSIWRIKREIFAHLILTTHTLHQNILLISVWCATLSTRLHSILGAGPPRFTPRPHSSASPGYYIYFVYLLSPVEGLAAGSNRAAEGRINRHSTQLTTRWTNHEHNEETSQLPIPRTVWGFESVVLVAAGVLVLGPTEPRCCWGSIDRCSRGRGRSGEVRGRTEVTCWHRHRHRSQRGLVPATHTSDARFAAQITRLACPELAWPDRQPSDRTANWTRNPMCRWKGKRPVRMRTVQARTPRL